MKNLIASIFCAFALLAQLPAFAAYYFSDCQTGRQDGCVAGDNSRSAATAQNPATPWQDWSAVTTHLGGVNNVAGGTQFLWARGGAWAARNYGIVNNPNCTIAADGTPTHPTGCIVFDAYTPSWGGTALPLLRGSGSVDTFAFGSAVTAVERGPYVFRNLKFDGGGSSWRLFNVIDASYFTVEDSEMTGFSGDQNVPVIQLNQSQSLGYNSVRNVQIRRNNFHDNIGVGAVLGGANGGVIEFNRFDNIGFTGGFWHCIYLSSHHSKNLIVRGNTFNNCSSNGSGNNQGGNLTVHGIWEGLVIEGNTFTAGSYSNGSIAISVTAGYADSGDYAGGECMRRVTVRGNRIGTGQSAMEFNHVPDILIESNLIQKRGGNGISWRTRDTTNDCADGNPTLRNNTVRIDNPSSSTAIALAGISPTGITATNNLVRFTGTGTGTYYGWSIPSVANLSVMTNNSTSSGATGGTFNWSQQYTSLAAAQAASASWDVNGLTSDPQFSATFTVPTNKASFSCALDAGSPVRNAGSATAGRRSLNAIDGRTWGGATPWIGACGPNN